MRSTRAPRWPTPHVAGVIALMLGINPALTPFDIDNALNARRDHRGHRQLPVLRQRADRRGARGELRGAGRRRVDELDPVLRVDPDGLNFGFLASELHVTASNGGNDQEPLTVTGMSFTSDDGAPWLTVTPESVDAAGLGTYRATVDRSGLADGLYTGTIVFASDPTTTVDVAVIMQVGDADQRAGRRGPPLRPAREPGHVRDGRRAPGERRRTASTRSASRTSPRATTCSSRAPTPTATSSSATRARPAARSRPPRRSCRSPSTATAPTSASSPASRWMSARRRPSAGIRDARGYSRRGRGSGSRRWPRRTRSG